jgi:hypothetical protein
MTIICFSHLWKVKENKMKQNNNNKKNLSEIMVTGEKLGR